MLFSFGSCPLKVTKDGTFGSGAELQKGIRERDGKFSFHRLAKKLKVRILSAPVKKRIVRQRKESCTFCESLCVFARFCLILMLSLFTSHIIGEDVECSEGQNSGTKKSDKQQQAQRQFCGGNL